MEYLIPIILVTTWVLDTVATLLNLRHSSTTVPQEFADCYDADKYDHAQQYLRTNAKPGLLEDLLMLSLMLGFLMAGGLPLVQNISRSVSENQILQGLAFFAVIGFLLYCLKLPFGLWRTFVIEEKFGFNRTTCTTWAGDQIKGLLLLLVLGTPVLAAVLWFFGSWPESGWWRVWLLLTAVQFLLMALAPTLIMPLFNKFTPLPEGDLRDAIFAYTRKLGFAVAEISVMDGSKRSSKANAFFSGFGKGRKIVLFDTLVEQHSNEELVAVLAHEIGHNKHQHIARTFVIATIASGIELFLLGLVLTYTPLFEAYGLGGPQVHTGLFLFGLLYGPVNLVLSILLHALSRHHEYQADHFAATTTGTGRHLISALKQLSVETLSNLTPHPLRVLLSYGHPPILERIRALRQIPDAA